MKRNETHLLLVLLSVPFVVSGCQSARPNTAAGGLFGTAAGTAIGAAIGSHDGNSGKGALIGGLAGGTLGALAGNQADEANARDERNFNAQAQLAQQSAITMDQIVQMTRSGLSNDLIVNQINMNGILARPTTNDLILLKQNGVSETVIQALQNASLAGSRVLVKQRAPVMVQPDVIYAEPWCHGPPAYYHHPHHYRHRHGGSRVGFSVGF